MTDDRPATADETDPADGNEAGPAATEADPAAAADEAGSTVADGTTRPVGLRNRIRAVPASRLAKGITGGLVCLVALAGIALATTLPRAGAWSSQQVVAAGTLESLGLVTAGLHGATTLLDATVAAGNVVGSERLVDHLPGAAVHGTQLALAAAPLVLVVGVVLAFDQSSNWWDVGVALAAGGAVAGGAMAGVMGVAHAVVTVRAGGPGERDATATE